jgi:hypothetical protein
MEVKVAPSRTSWLDLPGWSISCTYDMVETDQVLPFPTSPSRTHADSSYFDSA